MINYTETEDLRTRISGLLKELEESEHPDYKIIRGIYETNRILMLTSLKTSQFLDVDTETYMNTLPITNADKSTAEDFGDEALLLYLEREHPDLYDKVLA